MEYRQQEMFSRTHMLLGEDGMDALARTNVAIFGIGGVGSWTAESLVRTGLLNLTIVDADTVALSNINRQAPATTLTVGKRKVEAMQHRLLEINPEARITAIHDIYTAGTANRFDFERYDYIIDAIDSLADKALLILNATRARHPQLLSSMGAALKLDPTRIRVAEFWDVKGCRLAAALRHRFKKSGIRPYRKFPCVYSDELLPNHPVANVVSTGAEHMTPMAFNKVAINGSLCHITAIFGLTLTGLLLRHLTSTTDGKR